MDSMRLSWKLGQVAGIDVYVHATFLLVFLVFPGVFAGGPLSPWNVLLVFSVFGCVLLHELGHALDGSPVRDPDPRHHALPDRRGGAARADASGARRRVVDRAGGAGCQLRARRGPLASVHSRRRRAGCHMSTLAVFLESLLSVNLSWACST